MITRLCNTQAILGMYCVYCINTQASNHLMIRFLLITTCMLLSGCSEAQEDRTAAPDRSVTLVSDTLRTDSGTVAVFDEIMDMARSSELADRPIGEIIQVVGEALIGAGYQDGLLDRGEVETLVVDLTAFDCVLFVENVLALVQAIAVDEYTFDAYVSNLEKLRYRSGALRGYCSRLHYFTDWIHDNDQRGNVSDITAELEGERLEKSLDFMSTHRDAYVRLASDSTYACIVDMERDVASQEILYIPQNRIEDTYAQLRPGDIIATATHIEGLDVTHTGFVVRTDRGGTGFLHASSTGEVKIADDLAEYILNNDVQTGIIVARPARPQRVQ